jgi:Tol biopolymer transport system component
LSVGRLSWLSNGRGLLLVAADQVSRQFQVWHLTYPGGAARRITSDLNNYRSVSLSADAARMVVVESEQMSNIWVAPNADASRARQITYGAGKYGRLAWTPDGKIIYSAAAGSARDLWLMDVNGKARQLTVESGMNVHPAVTGDGRYLLCSSSRAGSFNVFNIWRLNLDSSSARQLTGGSGEFFPQSSPDGKWVVYTSINSGKDTVWKVSIDGGQAIQLTDKVSAYPVVSPDGKFIACQYWDEQLNTQWSTVIIPFEGGPPIKSFSFRSSTLRWSPDGRALTYIDQRGGVSNIWSQPMAGGQPRQLTDFSGDRIFDFDWSRDGKQIVLSRGVVTNDVVLITDARRSDD